MDFSTYLYVYVVGIIGSFVLGVLATGYFHGRAGMHTKFDMPMAVGFAAVWPLSWFLALLALLVFIGIRIEDYSERLLTWANERGQEKRKRETHGKDR